ncbi:Dabb family protein [Cellulophaga fucicola]|uniref:Stress responsive A/B Barrel Domain n=1 Tax=Cellulophaga fucicola TaxID=76595 RepID=A0A1K1QXM6_9FLAO|nr:Dabb family protein [Cellulophaga fucicola]SFW64070.1 Stress responsive A/B Barrel Domain [Cellulophaga fucicola]
MNWIKSVFFIVITCNCLFGYAQPTKDTQTLLEQTDFKTTKYNTVTATTYKKNGVSYVFSGGDGAFINVFKLNASGELLPVGAYELQNKKGPARGIVASNIKGKDYLFIGNKGANTVEVYSITNSGSLEFVFTVADTSETYLGSVITLKVIHIKNNSYLFVGGLESTPGLSCFKIHKNGKLSHIQSLVDNDLIHTDGIIGMYSHKINGKTFLFTGGFQDNGISSFEVFNNGNFKNINNIADNTTNRYLTGAYPVNGVTLGDNHYVVVGHRHHKYYKRGNFIKKKDFIFHGDGVSVFKVNAAGELIPHSVLVNDATTKLAGQTRIEILKIDDSEALVAVGTRDDNSIQLCKLNANGVLTPSGVLDTNYPIYYGLASIKINENFFFLSGSVDPKVKKMFAYKVNFKPKNGKKLRHVVNLKYKDAATPKEVNRAVENFVALKNKIPEIIDFEWGINNSKEGKSKGFTHSFMLTFKDEKALEVYLVHKEHLALIKNIGSLIDDVFVMDYYTKE